jgi:beta-galactosidase
MNLGVQYYRPPFPNSRHWEDDFRRVADSGLNTVQLWVLWSWVEAAPGRWQFDDYDCLVELAGKRGLGVILSTIAEVQPLWIHREVPGSELVNAAGHKVVSVSRNECHFGITPGGCWDHPGVWDRMAEFLRQTVTRYRSAPNLRGWDAWNELRWNVHAEALVCYCDWSLLEFRKWLDEKYGGLEGLNAAWLRRYGQWDEVQPGRLVGRPFTEMMAFEHFITAKCDRHARRRYEVIKGLDPQRPVTVHAATPCPLHGGGGYDQAINRGNDWFFADALDGVGCSSFPHWFHMDDADFGLRVECVKSAARDKLVWLSEVQGGRASHGNQVHRPVDAPSQQRWIWNGLACGADTILFWCWRDEVFCSEAGGFGLIGADGLADQRLAAMKDTAAVLHQHEQTLSAYRPARPEVGVLFSPQTYYQNWALEGNAGRSQRALEGYCRALVRGSIPYMLVEERHLDVLDGLKVLFLPRTHVVDDDTAAVLERFVRAGGTLVAESECGAFASNGLYRYPEERFTARMSGACEVGRRSLTAETMVADVDGRTLTLGVTQWLTPWNVGKAKARVLGQGTDGALLLETRVGKGRLVLAASYLGEAYKEHPTADFEALVAAFVRGAGWTPEVEVLAPQPTPDAFVYLKAGASGAKRVLFVFYPDGCTEATLRFAPGFLKGRTLTNIVTDSKVAVKPADDGAATCSVPAGPYGFSVLVGA